MEELHADKNKQGQDLTNWLVPNNLGPHMLKANLKPRILDSSSTLLNSSSHSMTYFKSDLKISGESVNTGGGLEKI